MTREQNIRKEGAVLSRRAAIDGCNKNTKKRGEERLRHEQKQKRGRNYPAALVMI